MEDLRDPSFNVPPALLEHVHLISSHRFPTHQQALPLDAIVDYLLVAPQIVRDQAAVSWQYIRPPSNGTIFLTWQPQAQLQTTFATDGYFWPEPEQNLQKEAKGYAIHIFIADSGYLLGSEQVASHRRVRYRLTGSRRGDTVDSHLEIVHYLKGPIEKHIPVQNLPNNPSQVRLQKSRQYLESAGSLERKEFMLSDRTNWPKITMPGQRTPSMPPGYTGRPPVPGVPSFTRPMPANMHGHGRDHPMVNPYQNAMARQQGLRRSTHSMPRGAPQGSGAEMDQDMIDEDATAVGDALDNIRPHDVSIYRYMQHEENMEEVTSSAYNVSQIRGADIVLHYAAGELADLTEGLFRLDEETGRYDVTEESLSELERRTADFTTKQHEEMDRLRNGEDTKNMLDMSTIHRYLDLERRAKDGELGEYDPEASDELPSSGEPKLVSKGGRLTKDELDTMQKVNTVSTNDVPTDEMNEFTNMDSAGEALDFYSGDLFEDRGMDFINQDDAADFA